MKRLLLSAAMLAVLSVSAQSTTRQKYVSTNVDKLNTELLQAENARMLRTLYHGYNTVCLPYSIGAEAIEDVFGTGARIEKPVGAATEGSDFVLYFSDCTDEGIEAGMPYLVHTDDIRFATIRNNGEGLVTEPASVSFSDGQGNKATFRGSFERLTPVGSWAIPAVQGEVPSTLICCDGERTLNPTRCFFTWDTKAGATNMVICHLEAGAIVTGIQGAEVTLGNGATYNVAGQRVQQGHGVLIQSGKKKIVK